MKNNLVRVLLLVLLLAAVLGIAVIKLDALHAQTCRGSDACDAVYDACAFEHEIAFIDRLGAFCDGDSNCITEFRIVCWDWEEEVPYYTYETCNSPTDMGECREF